MDWVHLFIYLRNVIDFALKWDLTFPFALRSININSIKLKYPGRQVREELYNNSTAHL